jgi:hypothetical protein
MRTVWGKILLIGACVWLLSGPQRAFAQACKDEASMVEGSKQGLSELIQAVKNEGLPDFQRLNHQKSAVNKLSLHVSMMGELVSCLEKAAQDTTASKEQVEVAKTQRDAAAKLQEKIRHELDAIKDAKVPKEAKALLEKVDLTS